MKRIFTKIPAFGFIVAVLFTAGCLSDDLERSDNGSGTGSTEPTIPDNSVIDALPQEYDPSGRQQERGRAG